MLEILAEDLFKKVPSTYKLVVLASRRAIEINEGAAKLVSTRSERPSQVALEEIKEGRIAYREKEAK